MDDLFKSVSLFGTCHSVSAPRPGLRKFGVPPGGAWDQVGFDFCQLFLPGAEAVEIATTAHQVFAEWAPLVPQQAIFWGAGFSVRVGSQSARTPCWLKALAGDQVHLISRGGGRLQAHIEPREASQSGVQGLDFPVSTPSAIPFYPQGERVSALATVNPTSSREGIRLQGSGDCLPQLIHSEPSVLGVIQATPDGTLLVHGPEGPTTGGYGRLGAFGPYGTSCLSRIPPGAQVEIVGDADLADQFEAEGEQERRRAITWAESLKLRGLFS